MKRVIYHNADSDGPSYGKIETYEMEGLVRFDASDRYGETTLIALNRGQVRHLVKRLTEWAGEEPASEGLIEEVGE